MSLELLLQRTVSSFPISIGTALALESFFSPMQKPYDDTRQIPQIVNLSDYQEFWINLSTLFRNLIGAIPASDMMNVRAEDCATVLLYEISVIDELTKNATNQYTKPQYYLCHHSKLESHFPLANIRQVVTEKQRNYQRLHDKTMKIILDKQSSNTPFKTFNFKVLPDDRVSVLILTHVALDLIYHAKFKSLHLIESHTGLLKKKNLWYTKYYQGKNLVMMPFNHGLLQFFGDNEIFHPFKLSARESVIENAKKCHWTPLTTQEKVMMDLTKINDPYLVSVVKSLFTIR